ncbi:MAG: alpha/beta hydrolase [Trebonia sp.]
MPSFTRSDVTFPSGNGRCAAWYYAPRDDGEGVPIIVMAHGFAGVRRLRLDSYAEKFADAGYRALLFDYRHFGDSPGEPRQLLDIDQQLADWRCAVVYARSTSAAAPARVVLWGTSLGGGHVLTTAARDKGLTAVVAQVPHVSGIAAARSVGTLNSVRLAALGLVDLGRTALGRSPYYIPAAGAPGTVAAMTSPDAVPGMDQLISQSNIGRQIDPMELMVSARVILRIARYAPGRRAAQIDCPVLVQIANQDAITPTRVADRAARRIPQATVKHYDLKHFDPYVEPHFTGVVADQLAFLEGAAPL